MRHLALLLVLTVAACSHDTAAPPAATPAPVPTATAATGAAVPTGPAAPEDPLSPMPPLETAPPATAGAVCRVGDLTVVDADSVSTGGYARELFVLRTTGPDCRLQGYPAVRFLGPDGRALALGTQHGGFGLPAQAPAPHTLSRGTSLSFAVASREAGSCVQVARLEVRLPGTSGPTSASTSMSVCGGRVGLSPVGRLSETD